MKHYTILSTLLITSLFMQGMETSISSSKELKNGLFGKFNAVLLSQNFNMPGKNFEVKTVCKPYSIIATLNLITQAQAILVDGNDIAVVKKESLNNSETLTNYLKDSPLDSIIPVIYLETSVENEAKPLANALNTSDFDKEDCIENLLESAFIHHKYEIKSRKLYDRMGDLITQLITSPGYIEKLIQLTEGKNNARIREKLTKCILSRCRLRDIELKKLEKDTLLLKEKLLYKPEIDYFVSYNNSLLISQNNHELVYYAYAQNHLSQVCSKIIAVDLKTKNARIQASDMREWERPILITPSRKIITYDGNKLRAYSLDTLESTDCEFFDETNNAIHPNPNTRFTLSNDGTRLLQLAYNVGYIYTFPSKNIYTPEDIQNNEDFKPRLNADYVDFAFAPFNKQIREKAKKTWANTNIIDHVTPDGSKVIKEIHERNSKKNHSDAYDASSGTKLSSFNICDNIVFSKKDIFAICRTYNYAAQTSHSTIISLTSGKPLATPQNADNVRNMVITSDNKKTYGITENAEILEWKFKEEIFEKFPTDTTLEKALNIAHQEALEQESIKPNTPVSQAASTDLD